MTKPEAKMLLSLAGQALRAAFSLIPLADRLLLGGLLILWCLVLLLVLMHG